ncbi:MAG: hypothetical protein ABI563_10275 [Specibacter sp.]
MSTPNEFDGPEQTGSQPPPAGSQPVPNTPPPGYQQPGYQQPAPPAGSMPPPGYQQPGYQAPPPGYQQPGYQQPAPPAGNFKFEMPKDAPRSMNEVMPAGGFGGMFKMDGLPQLLKISYIIWLVSAGLWLLSTFFLLIGSLFALGAKDNSILGITIPGSGAEIRAQGIKGIVVAIISLALILAIVVCAMKLKEGMQWARMALSVIAFLSIVLLFFGAGGGLLGIVATVLMWLPESTAWLNSRSKGVTQ